MDIDPQIAKRKLRRVAFLGVLLMGLGVVFMRNGNLGTIFMLVGAALLIYAFIKKNR